MSFLGMSYLEILVVALVAFVFLGPERMVGVARNLGKMVRTVRAMAAAQSLRTLLPKAAKGRMRGMRSQRFWIRMFRKRDSSGGPE